MFGELPISIIEEYSEWGGGINRSMGASAGGLLVVTPVEDGSAAEQGRLA